MNILFLARLLTIPQGQQRAVDSLLMVLVITPAGEFAKF